MLFSCLVKYLDSNISPSIGHILSFDCFELEEIYENIVLKYFTRHEQASHA
jgi:hypothetical protein